MLTKFLRASLMVEETAVARIQKTILWRKEFGVEQVLTETFPEEFSQAGYVHGVDLVGRPVMFNVYGVHQEIFSGKLAQVKLHVMMLLTSSVFLDLNRFLRWRVQLMEHGIKQLDFHSANSLVQIHDYDGVSMFSSTESTKAAARETVKLFAEHYPELLAKKFFINVPWYMAGFYSFLQPLIPAKTAEKFVICSSGYKEDLLKVIPVDSLPVKYGGLSRLGNEKILVATPPELGKVTATAVTISARTFHAVEAKIEQAAEVYWEFVLLEDDIEFACNFVDHEGKLTSVEAVRKVEAAITVGKFAAPSAGTLKLVFDNSNSIFTSKLVYHRHLVVATPASATE